MKKHKWKCVSVGMYDSIYKCKKCNNKYILSVDNVMSVLPKRGCT